MKTILLASVATIALCSASAFAADMPTKGPAYKAEPMFNWTGFYAGVSGGYGWSKEHQENDITLLSGSDRLKGYFLGGTVGYNWQFNSNWVFGVEGDWSGANIDKAAAFDALLGITADTIRINSFGTARARLGYAATDRTLWYVTGGWGWAEKKIDEQPVVLLSSTSKTESGWAAGAGVEHAIANNWSLKLEYIHIDLGHKDFATVAAGITNRVSEKLDIVRVGVNYKFGDWGKGPVSARY